MGLSARHHDSAAQASPRGRSLPGIALGTWVLLAGVAMTLAGLWAPWYRLDILGTISRAVPKDFGKDDPTGLVAEFARALSPDGLTIPEATAWQAFQWIDLAIGGLALLAVVALVAAHLRVVERFPSDLITATSLAAGGLVILRVVRPPGPPEAIDIAWGPWLTLAGAAVMVIGARLRFKP